MATDLIEIDIENPYSGAVDRAIQEINRGGVVGVPTDALYVLVADPFNLQAVGRVFAAKGREHVRSLPLAVSDTLRAEDLLYPGAPFLARSADDDCAGGGQGAAEGHRQYGTAGHTPTQFEHLDGDD